MVNHNFLYYLYNHPCGKVSELKELYGDESVCRMEDLGYITLSPSEEGDTWKRTDSATRLTNACYRKSSMIEKIKDFINIHIRKIDFSI